MIKSALKAKVVDIRTIDPKPEFRFVVDTNVWYWLAYSRASTNGLQGPRVYQVEQYSHFIKKSLDAGSTIVRCELALAEVAHIIENVSKLRSCRS